MERGDVKLGAGFPKEKSGKVIVLLYAQAKASNALCNAGASGRKKREANGKELGSVFLEVEFKQASVGKRKGTRNGQNFTL